MPKWDADAKNLWHKVALCGGKITKRGPMRQERSPAHTIWGAPRWYIEIPRNAKKDYVMGPYDTKTEAVFRAAELMEINRG